MAKRIKSHSFQITPLNVVIVYLMFEKLTFRKLISHFFLNRNTTTPMQTKYFNGARFSVNKTLALL